MAATSLFYPNRSEQETDLTKAGFLIYGGSIKDFHEWEFRSLTRVRATKEDERWQLGAKFLDSLHGGAYTLAEDLGSQALVQPDAIEKIAELVRGHIFPLTDQEAKELYRMGTAIGGALSRQPGESMVSYTNRRKRWYRKLKQLDKSVEISEGVLVDLLLDCSGLNRQEKLMVQTATHGNATWRMHGKIHVLESRGRTPYPYAKNKGKGKNKPYYGSSSSS
jgi:hypothetical protein